MLKRSCTTMTTIIGMKAIVTIDCELTSATCKLRHVENFHIIFAD